jgi:hypothetical protein
MAVQKPVLRKKTSDQAQAAKPVQKEGIIRIKIRIEGCESCLLEGELLKVHPKGWMTVRLIPNSGQLWPDGYPNQKRTLEPKEITFYKK